MRYQTTMMAAAAAMALADAAGQPLRLMERPRDPGKSERWRHMSRGDISAGGWAGRDPWGLRVLRADRPHRHVEAISAGDAERIRLAEMKRARKAARLTGAPMPLSPVREPDLSPFRRLSVADGTILLMDALWESACVTYPGGFTPHGYARRLHRLAITAPMDVLAPRAEPGGPLDLGDEAW